MSKKIALQGFDRLKMFPILTNTSTGYSVGEGFAVTGAQEMTKENDTGEQKFYADDGLYLNAKQFNAINTNITVLEMPLETLEKLGFGTYDAAKNEFTAEPQGKNLEFALTFRCLNTGGEYRMYKYFCFTVNEIKESAAKTKGNDVSLGNYQIIGSFTARKKDGKTYVMKDGDASECTWLDTVATEGSGA